MVGSDYAGCPNCILLDQGSNLSQGLTCRTRSLTGAGVSRLVVGIAASVGLSAPATAQYSHLPKYEMHVPSEAETVDPAVTRRYTIGLAACQKQASTTQANAECFEAEFRRQDSALNGLWRSLSVRASAKVRIPLLGAQRRWSVDRDPFCKASADASTSGTATPLIYSSCRVDETIRRMIWLEGLRRTSRL